jgi:homoaconitate hydratase
MKAKINFSDSVISVDSKTYPVSPVGEAAQELIIAGGLEEWVRKNL